MGLKFNRANLSVLAKETTLRLDVNFVAFNQRERNKSYLFRDLFEIVEYTKSQRQELLGEIETDEFRYVEISNVNKQGDVEPVLLNASKRNELVEDYFKKIEKADIQKATIGNYLISKVRPNLKKYVYIDQVKSNYYYTTAFIQLKPKKLGKVMYYCLRDLFHENIMSIARRGKGYPTIKKEDLYYLKFDAEMIDNLMKDNQELLNYISSVEDDISKMQSGLRSQQDIINGVINDNVDFDVLNFDKLKELKCFPTSLYDFACNRDLRMSAKFHRPAGKHVQKDLVRLTNKKIKDYLLEDICLGEGVSPRDFDDYGKYYYISMATIKDWRLDCKAGKKVSDEYSFKRLKKSVRKDDILIARSGEGTIGKVALIEDDIDGIFSDFIMRIRLNNYNKLFAYYYFRSSYFQYLIEINKKGLGNNTNIFPSQIREFPLLKLPSTKEKDIVNSIKSELDAQEHTHSMIKELRDNIYSYIKEHIYALN